MCVVCLDCGKRFHYDWELMRIGGPVENEAASQATSRKSRLRYLFAACALPLVWLLGKTAIARTHSKQEKKPL